MVLFPWTDQYVMGVDEIDRQHRRLVDLINRLYDALTRGQAHAELQGILDALVEYAASHFAAEEGLMTANSYPGVRTHQLAHQALLQQLTIIKGRAGHDLTALSLELMEFLRHWLHTHILEMDHAVGAYLVQRGVPGGLAPP